MSTWVALACGGPEGTEDADALVLLLPREPQEIDPRFAGDLYGMKLSRLLFASLVRVDPDTLEAVPDLAERVEVVTPTHYRVTLRPGLRFSDASPLDAADVVATFEGVISPALGSRYASTYRRIARVEARSARVVDFHLTGAHAPFLTDLELPVMRAEDALRHVGGVDMPPPIGAGPYVLRDRRPGRFVLGPNPHWHAGTPRHPDVVLRVIRDDNTRALRLLARRGDVVLAAMPPLLQPLLERAPGFELQSAPGISTTYLGINTEAGPLSDPRVRRAIALAIDRERIVDAKFGGRARVAASPIPEGHWAAVPDLSPLPHDPERARELLAAAGYREGLSLSLRCGSDRFRMSISRILAAMLSEVGIEVTLRASETATLIADLNRGRFDLTLMQLPEVIEPHVLSWFFASDHIPGDGVEGANRWRLRSAALDAALERGRAQTDRAARVAAYAEVQRVLADELPVVPLWHEDVVQVRAREIGALPVARNARFDHLAR